MSGEDRPSEALEHLQRAVLEMIQAARSTLDLLEDVVADPQILATVVSQVGQVAQALVSAAAQGAGRPPGADAPSPPAARPAPPRTGRPNGPAGGGVQRIPVN